MQVTRQFTVHFESLLCAWSQVELYHVGRKWISSLTQPWWHGDTDCTFKMRERPASGQGTWVFIGSCDCCPWFLGPSLHTSLLTIITHLSRLWDILSWISMSWAQPSSQTQSPTHHQPLTLPAPHDQVSHRFSLWLCLTLTSLPLFILGYFLSTSFGLLSYQSPQCLKDVS